jgi:hypothetical protein
MQKFLMWIIWNIPLGKFAPYVFGLVVGRAPKKVLDKQKKMCYNDHA